MSIYQFVIASAHDAIFFIDLEIRYIIVILPSVPKMLMFYLRFSIIRSTIHTTTYLPKTMHGGLYAIFRVRAAAANGAGVANTLQERDTGPA